ncbi:MAG TPA: hypothetical protein PKI19_12795 [Elusimicrobiales bacterium]|mgnify:CR=1 FL=1|nr:hypothetical protein [Elusimicrobiales bacterium]
MAKPAAGVVKVTDWYSLRKVVYYSADYPASLVNNSAELARAFVDAGFVPLTAAQLREWMTAQAAGGAGGSICFFSQDVVPDMVAEQCSQDCLFMAYLKAGGRAVWVGDIPFFYQGREGGGTEVWGREAQQRILGLESVRGRQEEVRVTDAGRDWGLTVPDKSVNCVPAGDVTAALTAAGKFAVSFFKNFNPASPESGFLRLGELMPVRDLLRAAQYGIEEPEDTGETPEQARAAVSDGGVLVASGSFVVDRQRALDKLMRFQLPDQETCLLPIVRCALAGKASGVAITEPLQGGLQIRFDGEVFSSERLADPYSALFEPRTPANAAARHLATGLLCALRLKPQVLTVTTGLEGARFQLRIDALGKEAIRPSEDPGSGTVVNFIWRGIAPLRNGRLLAHVRARCALSPVPVLIDGKDILRTGRNPGGQGLYFEDRGMCGYLAVPENPAAMSTFTAAVNNVTLEMPMSAKLPYLQVSGYLNNDDFTMNISQTGVVNNTRCAKALDAVGRNIPALLDRIVNGQRPNLPAIGKMMVSGGMLPYWKKCLEAGPQLDAGLLGGLLKDVTSVVLYDEGRSSIRRDKAELFIRDSARVTLWLRAACSRLLTDYEKDSADPILKVLWEAPAFLTINGDVRCLRQVDAQQQKMGFVAYSTVPYPKVTLPFDVLCAPSLRDLEPLRRWNTADLSGKIAYYGGNPAAVAEFMGGSGRYDIDIAPPIRQARTETAPVEISLSAIKAPAPAQPAPPAGAPAVTEALARSRSASMPPHPAHSSPAPLPSEEQLAADPAANFPEFLALRAGGLNVPGAGLVANFIREQAAGRKWIRKPLAADVLASALPPLRKAEYLLSVFYTDFNRQEVKLTDADDINFQQALAEQIERGGKENGK